MRWGQPWWYRDEKTSELCLFLSATAMLLFPASATESVLTAFILSDVFLIYLPRICSERPCVKAVLIPALKKQNKKLEENKI